ncbi:hypothetical protein TNCV_1851661 [Trichonephila clavipes]|nr:hypothetical protein TNCV_1851661 [Trichonephila clavipes]
MAVMNRVTRSRTIMQQIQTATHHPLSARKIRRRLTQSGMSARMSERNVSIAFLTLDRNHKHLRHQWFDER